MEIFNIGTWSSWANKVKDIISGKPDYLGNAKNLLSTHLITKNPPITASSLMNLINQYNNNPPNTISASIASPYYLYNSLVIVAKSIYTNLQNGLYDTYANKLEGNTNDTKYSLSVPIDDNSAGAKFFVFLFKRVKNDVIGSQILKLNSMVGTAPALYNDITQKNVTKFINDTYFSNGSPTDQFIADYKKENASVIQKGGRKNKTQKNKTRKNKTRKNKTRKK